MLLDNLGMSLFDGAPLAVLAALVTSTSRVLVLTFFTSFLSGFFAYLYTWYCFPVLFSLKNKMQTIPLEAFYSELGLRLYTLLTRYLQYRYLKQIFYGRTITK